MNSVASSDKLVREMLAQLEPPMPIVDGNQANSEVAKFYAGRCVFITGATGFIGKALIEKLLRSCENIKRIYVLIREKRGKDVQERLADLVRSQCFDRLRELHKGNNEALEEKLYAIKGDITLPKFGISPEDMKLLAGDCTIVFNSAATIRFVEPIEVAVRNNIYSVGQLVEFCDQLTQLEALIHLSTAYSNCHKRDTIHEILYEPPMRAEQIQESLDQLRSIQNQIHVYKELEQRANHDNDDDDDESEDHDDSELGCPPAREHCKLQRFFFDNRLVKSANESALSMDLLEEFTRVALRRSNRPNTYTFTKAISESFLVDKVRAKPERYLGPSGIPVAIIRPSIVGGAWREPFVGQVDNFNGPTGAILSLYTGALQAMPGIGQRIADLVPVDMVSNMVLCTGWFLLAQKSSSTTSKSDSSVCLKTTKRGQVRQDHGIYLFNFVSGNRNPLHWELVTQLISQLAYKYPSKYLVRLPSSYFLRGGPLYDLYDLINQKFPAYLMDLIKGKIMGQDVSGKSSSLYAYSRVRQMTETLTSFTSNQWKFCDTNVRFLFDSLAPIDKQMFHFDVTSINWPDYITKYIIGSRIYTLKDEAKNLPRAMVMMKRRRIAHGITMAFLIFLFYQLFISGSQLDICTLFNY